MPKAKESGSALPANIDPEARYSVKLSRPVKRGHRTMSPMDDHIVKGKVLSEMPPEAVAHAEQV